MTRIKTSIGKIPYSLGARLSKPNDKNSEKKVYAYAQRDETIGTAALAEHMAGHYSVYSPGTINGVLTDMSRCIKELLLEGNRISLDGLLTLFTTLRSSGADSAENFTDAMITHVNIRAAIDQQLVDEVNSKARFEQVAGREQQAQGLKQDKQDIDTFIGGGSGSGSNSGGNNGGQADPGDVTP